MSGEKIYNELKFVYKSDKAASLKLKELGIPGLKYLDGSSRSKGKGFHNFVVFDDNHVKIDETYYKKNPRVS